MPTIKRSLTISSCCAAHFFTFFRIRFTKSSIFSPSCWTIVLKSALSSRTSLAGTRCSSTACRMSVGDDGHERRYLQIISLFRQLCGQRVVLPLQLELFHRLFYISAQFQGLRNRNVRHFEVM
uniref:(northern house mosquito) hypothetical protein n=1 Tax=Culex pipiens TaxID=7175 RepID=A0A8D8I7Y0_CULPI